MEFFIIILFKLYPQLFPTHHRRPNFADGYIEYSNTFSLQKSYSDFSILMKT